MLREHGLRISGKHERHVELFATDDPAALPPFAHAAVPAAIEEGMVLAIEPAVYWPGGGGLRLEDNFLVTAAGSERLSGYPDDFRLAGAR